MFISLFISAEKTGYVDNAFNALSLNFNLITDIKKEGSQNNRTIYSYTPDTALLKDVNTLISKVNYFNISQNGLVEIYHKEEGFIEYRLYVKKHGKYYRAILALDNKWEILDYCKINKKPFCTSKYFKRLIVESAKEKRPTFYSAP